MMFPQYDRSGAKMGCAWLLSGTMISSQGEAQDRASRLAMRGEKSRSDAPCTSTVGLVLLVSASTLFQTGGSRNGRGHGKPMLTAASRSDV